MLAPGDVIYAMCNGIIPAHTKYCICISLTENKFLLINSRPYGILPFSQLKVTPKELPFLAHDSFIDTVQIFPIEEAEIKRAVAKGKIWPLDKETKNRIKFSVEQHGALPQKIERFILENF